MPAPGALPGYRDLARERYGLGAPSSVAKALSVLVAREVLAREAPRYVFGDPFFRRWVRLSSAIGAAPERSRA